MSRDPSTAPLPLRIALALGFGGFGVVSLYVSAETVLECVRTPQASVDCQVAKRAIGGVTLRERLVSGVSGGRVEEARTTGTSGGVRRSYASARVVLETLGGAVPLDNLAQSREDGAAEKIGEFVAGGGAGPVEVRVYPRNQVGQIAGSALIGIAGLITLGLLFGLRRS